MLVALRVIALIFCALPLVAQPVRLFIPVKPIFSRPQQALPSQISSFVRPSSPYTLDLGPEIVKGACASTMIEIETSWLFFQKQSSVLRYVDGRRKIIVSLYVRDTIANSQALQPSQIELGLRQCLVPQTASDEESLRSEINLCLTASRASFEVSYLTTSVGELQCPTAPDQKQVPLK